MAGREGNHGRQATSRQVAGRWVIEAHPRNDSLDAWASWLSPFPSECCIRRSVLADFGVSFWRHPQMFTTLGVITKGTIIEVNVSELGLVTPGGKVVWGKYAQVGRWRSCTATY